MTKKTKRKTLSKRELHSLNAFYHGRRCIVTSSSDNTDWHHLDDDHSNSHFSNLVPLSRDYNNKLEIYRRYQRDNTIWKGTDPHLSPDFLLIKSRSYFRTGDISLAYGCARLASRLLIQYPSLFPSFSKNDFFDYIFQSLSCARHSNSQALIEDIIIRDIIPSLKEEPIGQEVKILLQLEFGAIFQEYGYYDKSTEIFNIIQKNIKFITGAKEIYLAKLLRRIALNNIEGEFALNTAENLLNEADQLIGRPSANLHVGVSNANAWQCLALGNASKAIDILNPIIEKIFTNSGEYRQDLVAPWNALESIMTYLRALESIERSGKIISASDQLDYSLKFFSRKGIQLRPIAFDLSIKAKGEISDNLKNKYSQFIPMRNDKMKTSLYKVIENTLYNYL